MLHPAQVTWHAASLHAVVLSHAVPSTSFFHFPILALHVVLGSFGCLDTSLWQGYYPAFVSQSLFCADTGDRIKICLSVTVAGLLSRFYIQEPVLCWYGWQNQNLSFCHCGRIIIRLLYSRACSVLIQVTESKSVFRFVFLMQNLELHLFFLLFSFF